MHYLNLNALNVGMLQTICIFNFPQLQLLLELLRLGPPMVVFLLSNTAVALVSKKPNSLSIFCFIIFLI